MKSFQFTIPAIAMLFTGSMASQATLIAYEGFDSDTTYTVGAPITGLSGGTGWTSPFATTAMSFNSANPGLVAGALQTTTGQATVPLDPLNPFNFVANTRTLPPVSSGDLWISWLYSPGSPETIYSGLGLSRTSGGELLYIGTDGNGELRVDTLAAGGTNATYGALTAGTLFIAVHLDFSTGQIDVFRNPVPGDVAPESPVASFPGLTLAEVSSLVFLGGANGVTSFDEIRVGTSYPDVAPQAVFGAHITSAQLITGNTQFQIEVAGLEGGKNYKLQQSLLLDGFADIPGSEFTADSSTGVIVQAVDSVIIPKQFFRITDVP